MMTYDNFMGSYNDVLFYLSDKDPLFTEYLVAKLPHPLQVEKPILKRVRKQKNTWLAESRKKVSKNNIQKLSKPLSVSFNNSVYNIACVYTYGTNNIVPNFDRAYKYIRMLKLLKDDRYIELRKEINTRKRKRNQKILETIKQ